MASFKSAKSGHFTRVVMVGHVDHGKSTLVGRLLNDTNSVPQSRWETVAKACETAGKNFEYAFLLDALEEERDQGITIDVTQVKFHSEARDYVLIDAPGHKEFLKNMISGAASAEAAVLLIDASEGVQEQSKRHGYLLRLLGIRHIIVAVNKMDLVDYSEKAFEELKQEYLGFLNSINVHPRTVIPIAAREGQNITTHSSQMPWHTGPTLLDALDALPDYPSKEDLDLRFPVQDVYKFDQRRIIAGRISSGKIAEGDEIAFFPSGRRAIVKTIERWNAPPDKTATAGQSIGITLTEPLFVERGEIIAAPDSPLFVGSELQAHIFWMGERHLVVGRDYTLKLATQEARCQITSIDEVIDAVQLETATGEKEIARNEVAKVTLSLHKPIAFDSFGRLEETGRFVLVDHFNVAGGGIILNPVEPSCII
ncbi:MAG: GTP-binding protein [bacterium]